MTEDRLVDIPPNDSLEPAIPRDANSADNDGDDANRAHGKQDVIGPPHGQGKELLRGLLAEEGDERAHARAYGVDEVGPVLHSCVGRWRRRVRRQGWRHTFDDLTRRL